MKLNYDCLRALLLAVEEHEYIDSSLKISELWHSDLLELPSLKIYEKNDITYAAMIAIEANLLQGKFQASNEEVDYLYIMRLTSDGHTFIESIRPERVWDVISSFGEDIGTMSIDIIKETAPQVLAEMWQFHSIEE